jgi:hypothetical protein
MTPDMKFEGLLVSRDIHVLKEMTRIMEDLSIDVDLCMFSNRALDILGKREIDLLVIDCEDHGSASEILGALGSLSGSRRITTLAIVNGGIPGEPIRAGAHVVVQKPLSDNFQVEFRDLVYARMVAERRQQHRYAVRWLVAAKDMNGNPVQVTVTDLSEAGIGFSFAGRVSAGDRLKLRVMLTGANQIIQFDARAVWTLRSNIAGAEIVSISAADSDVLRKWLKQKHEVKNAATQQPNCQLSGV